MSTLNLQPQSPSSYALAAASSAPPEGAAAAEPSTTPGIFSQWLAQGQAALSGDPGASTEAAPASAELADPAGEVDGAALADLAQAPQLGLATATAWTAALGGAASQQSPTVHLPKGSAPLGSASLSYDPTPVLLQKEAPQLAGDLEEEPLNSVQDPSLQADEQLDDSGFLPTLCAVDLTADWETMAAGAALLSADAWARPSAPLQADSADAEAKQGELDAAPVVGQGAELSRVGGLTDVPLPAANLQLFSAAQSPANKGFALPIDSALQAIAGQAPSLAQNSALENMFAGASGQASAAPEGSHAMALTLAEQARSVSLLEMATEAPAPAIFASPDLPSGPENLLTQLDAAAAETPGGVQVEPSFFAGSVLDETPPAIGADVAADFAAPAQVGLGTAGSSQLDDQAAAAAPDAFSATRKQGAPLAGPPLSEANGVSGEIDSTPARNLPNGLQAYQASARQQAQQPNSVASAAAEEVSGPEASRPADLNKAPSFDMASATALAPAQSTSTPAALAPAAEPGSRQPVALENVHNVVADRLLRGEGTLLMQVTPPDLGALDIEVRLHQGAVFVSMRAENAAVAQHLEQHVGELSAQLQEAGIDLGGVDIGSRDAAERSLGESSSQAFYPSQDTSGGRQSAQAGALGLPQSTPSQNAGVAPALRRHRGVLDVIA